MIKYKYLLLLLCFGASVNTFAQRNMKMPEIMKVPSTLQMIEQLYVEDIKMHDLIEKAIINIVKELDPHSAYISKEDFEAMNSPLEGNFEGIGIEFNIFEDTLIVVNPLVGGPSEKVGIIANDRIVTVDSKNIASIGLKSDTVFKLLRGEKGTKIKLGIKRRGANEILEFVVTRDKIPLNSLDADYLVKPGMLYLKLGRFAKTSMDEIDEAYKKYDEVNSLILDLRGNGGGFLGVAGEITEQFFDKGKLLVYTEGKKEKKTSMLSRAKGKFKDLNLVVLVDQHSASASEILSGAIQDWDRGIIIGRRTFGKGLVQEQIPYGDGSYLRLTRSRYHTPTGRVIQRPYNNGDTEQYYKDLFKRYEKGGEVYNTDSIKFPDSLKYKTLKNERTVYGGGGIMPDIFVPIDTTSYSKYRNQIYQKGILMQYLIPLLEKEKENYKNKYSDASHFYKKFKVNDKMFKSFVDFAEKEGVEKNEQGIKISGDELKLVIKALIAKDLFGYSEYFRIINSDRATDEEYSKAIEVLDNWDKFEKEILNPRVE